MACCLCKIISSFFSKLLEPVVLLTLGLVVVTYFQYLVQKKAHALNLFSKRWQAFNELKRIGETAENFKHVSHRDILNMREKSYWKVYNTINLFADECEILFGEDIAKIGRETAENFKVYHTTMDSLNDLTKHNEEFSSEYIKKEKRKLFETKRNSSAKMYELFGIWYKSILMFIKNKKID